jgi:hypothetical protein
MTRALYPNAMANAAKGESGKDEKPPASHCFPIPETHGPENITQLNV